MPKARVYGVSPFARETDVFSALSTYTRKRISRTTSERTLPSLGPSDGTTTGLDLLSWTIIPCTEGHLSPSGEL